jgi:hypothetical protein
MAFTASPQQLKLLRQVVDDYCRNCGIDDMRQPVNVVKSSHRPASRADAPFPNCNLSNGNKSPNWAVGVSKGPTKRR